VALGPKTMRAPDSISVTEPKFRKSADAPARPVTVVGKALVNAGFTVEAGEVAVVDARWFGAPRTRQADTILLRASTAHPDWGSMNTSAFSVLDAPPPPGVRNLRRIDGVPGVIAIVVDLAA
jgi:hypothetical protein